MTRVSNAVVKQAVEKAAKEHSSISARRRATREIVTHEAEGLKAHANEKAGDIRDGVGKHKRNGSGSGSRSGCADEGSGLPWRSVLEAV